MKGMKFNKTWKNKMQDTILSLKKHEVNWKKYLESLRGIFGNIRNVKGSAGLPKR